MTEQRDIRVSDTSPDWQRIAVQQDHRQWASPTRPWLMRQTWQQLLFAHWPVPPAALRPFIPAQLELDTFGGDAWVGIVPFDLRNLTARRAPHQLQLTFPELNVRTYVTVQHKPGVWFFSLDAASLMAVRGARAVYHLPYFWASMQMTEQDGWVAFRSQRRGDASIRFEGRYQPTGPVFESAPESLERWLTARYCFYSNHGPGQIMRAEVNHDPWLLQPAEAEITVNTLLSTQGIDLSGSPILHFSPRTDVVNWGLERVV